MLEMYGTERTADEIVRLVREHRAEILANPTHRYHVLMGLTPAGGSSVLDYGCGWGINSVGMAERGNEVLGIDASANEVEICRLVWSDQPGLGFETSEMSAIPSASVGASAVERLASRAWCHCLNSSPITFMKSSSRLLKARFAWPCLTPACWPIVSRVVSE